jgi:hypothetical protein
MNNSIFKENNYVPPDIGNKSCPDVHILDSPSKYFSNNAPSNFSTSKKINQNEFGSMSYKLLHLENRISTFSNYMLILWIMITLSFFSVIISMSAITEKYKKYSEFQYFNFPCCLLHIASYFLGIQSYSRQSKDMNLKFQYSIFGLIVIEIVYFVVFFIYEANFFDWSSNLFFLLFNVILYYQTEELTKIFEEKEMIKSQYNLLSL